MSKMSLIAMVVVLVMTIFCVVQVKNQKRTALPPAQPQTQPIVENPWWEHSPLPENKEKPFTFEDAVKTITEEELKKDLYYLASEELEGRMSGKKGNIMAGDFIREKFKSFGLPCLEQQFKIRRMNPGPKNEEGYDLTGNIIAWKKGTEIPDEIVVIGAHMDHIGYGPSMSRSRKIAVHPGADDNASGTVALLEIAQAISMLKPKRTVVFIAFSAEEMGLIGSRYYCEHPYFPIRYPDIKKHIFMLNMDMIGYLGKGKFHATWGSSDSSDDITRYISELNSKYSFAQKITGRTTGGSDHASFYNKKVPIAFLHTGLHDYYHTPEDTPDKINYPGVEQIARYGFELAWKVINNEVTPTFNLATFKEMPYTHDHGHPEMPFHHHYHR